MLFDRDREVGSALDRCIVGNNDGLMAVNEPDACDQAGARRLIVVHAVGSESAELEERCVRIEYGVDAFTNEHLAAFLMTFDGRLTAALLDRLGFGWRLGDPLLH